MAGNSFVTHVLELLEPLGQVRARPMMGGHMVYCGALPVALIADERLYLKTDGKSKGAFSRAGGEPFTYQQRGRRVEMSYWSPPDAALDDAESMRPWAELAVAAAERSGARPRSGPRSSSGSKPRSRPRRRAWGRGRARGTDHGRGRARGRRPGRDSRRRCPDRRPDEPGNGARGRDRRVPRCPER
jgi:DNA transformation protein and related proteins